MSSRLVHAYFACAKHVEFLKISIASVLHINPDAMVVVFSDPADPLCPQSRQELCHLSENIRVADGTRMGTTGNGLTAFREEFNCLQKAVELTNARYVNKIDADILVCNQRFNLLLRTERFDVIGTAARWGIWGGYCFLHRDFVNLMQQADLEAIFERLRDTGMLIHNDMNTIPEDEFIAAACRLLRGEDCLYTHEPGPWIEGMFDAFHFNVSLSKEDQVPRKVFFFDAIEFGRRGELNMSEREAMAVCLSSMMECFEFLRTQQHYLWPTRRLKGAASSPQTPAWALGTRQ